MARRTKLTARVPSRVFRGDDERGNARVWAAYLSGTAVETWYGIPFEYQRRDGSRAAGTVERFDDEAAAAHAFEATCRARKKLKGWEEYRFDPARGRIVDDDPLLTNAHRLDVIETARRSVAGKRHAERAPAPVDRGELLRKLITGRGTMSVGGRPKAISKRRVKGDLVLPSGALVAADPMHLDGGVVFAQRLPPGAYAIELAIAGKHVAAATIRLRPQPPTRWELGLPRGGRSLVPPKRRQVAFPPAFGYPVDVALGAFMDKDGYDALCEDEDELALTLEPRRRALGTHALGAHGSAVVFETGFGDGTYAAYFGFRDDQLVCVTTDFGVV